MPALLSERCSRCRRLIARVVASVRKRLAGGGAAGGRGIRVGRGGLRAAGRDRGARADGDERGEGDDRAAAGAAGRRGSRTAIAVPTASAPAGEPADEGDRGHPRDGGRLDSAEDQRGRARRPSAVPASARPPWKPTRTRRSRGRSPDERRAAPGSSARAPRSGWRRRALRPRRPAGCAGPRAPGRARGRGRWRRRRRARSSPTLPSRWAPGVRGRSRRAARPGPSRWSRRSARRGPARRRPDGRVHGGQLRLSCRHITDRQI